MKIKYYDVDEVIKTNYVLHERRLTNELLEFFTNDERTIMSLDFDKGDNMVSRRTGIAQRLTGLKIDNYRTMLVRNRVYIIKT